MMFLRSIVPRAFGCWFGFQARALDSDRLEGQLDLAKRENFVRENQRFIDNVTRKRGSKCRKKSKKNR